MRRLVGIEAFRNSFDYSRHSPSTQLEDEVRDKLVAVPESRGVFPEG